MYNSLDERQLHTVKIEAPNPQFSSHGIRTNEDTNPIWFKEMCLDYPENRKKPRKRGTKYSDTKIQAIDLQTVLKNLIKNGYSHSSYAEDIIARAEGLREELKLAERLYRRGELGEEISTRCYRIRDLEIISMELPKEESFKVAEGFDKISEDSTENDTSLDDRIPF